MPLKVIIIIYMGLFFSETSQAKTDISRQLRKSLTLNYVPELKIGNGAGIVRIVGNKEVAELKVEIKADEDFCHFSKDQDKRSIKLQVGSKSQNIDRCTAEIVVHTPDTINVDVQLGSGTIYMQGLRNLSSVIAVGGGKVHLDDLRSDSVIVSGGSYDLAFKGSAQSMKLSGGSITSEVYLSPNEKKQAFLSGVFGQGSFALILPKKIKVASTISGDFVKKEPVMSNLEINTPKEGAGLVLDITMRKGTLKILDGTKNGKNN